METESKLAEAKILAKKYHTWNIIFVAVDINSKYLGKANVYDYAYDETDAIHLGINNFEKDVKATAFSENINFFVLKFLSDKPKGRLHFSTSIESSGANSTFLLETDNSLDLGEMQVEEDIHNPETLTKYFTIINNRTKCKPGPQKYLIVFLAHSFGSAFLYHKDSTPEYFTTVQFRNAIQNSFRKIDCLLAVNCTLQSIESNAIFRNTVDLLIGSQQELYIDTIQYKSLFYDLANYSIADKSSINEGLCNEHLFMKYILNCHEAYTRNKEGQTAYPFCLTLSKPNNAKRYMFYLYLFSKLLNSNANDTDKNFVRFSKYYCADPSHSDGTNFFDAQQFFAKLFDFFTTNGDDKKALFVKELIDGVKNIEVFHLVSGSCTEEEEIESENLSIYIPNGLGIFLQKFKSETSEASLKIMQSFLKEDFFMPLNEWIEFVKISNVGQSKWLQIYLDIKEQLEDSFKNAATIWFEKFNKFI